MYDIYCPLMGGSPDRLNYFAISCVSRQENNTCRRSKCTHRMSVRHDAPVKDTSISACGTEDKSSKPAAKAAPKKRARHVSRLLANKRRLAERKGLVLAELQ